jgi:hypothetical protein
MGNSVSTSIKESEKKFDNFYEVIDYIATYYILTSDFQSLSRLTEKEYCDKLVILTSDIIERFFNTMNITYLAQRVKKGSIINELNKENLIFLSKDNLESLDISNDELKNIKKKRVCIGIAKFYIKIAHIFAAIVMTINPLYSYKDENGNIKEVPMLEKDKIPKNVDKKLKRFNICDNRIKALRKGMEEDIDDKDSISLKPLICNINNLDNSTLKNLENEPGIPELIRLYLDDEYDYSNGEFKGMSLETEKEYKKDLKLFYKAFTGNDEMPDNIKKFSDISLRDYKSYEGCKNNLYNEKYIVKKKDKLFIEYSKNIREMIENASNNQQKLLSIINELFSYVIDPYSNKKVIRINPKLNEELLQKAIIKARKLIIELYIKCEEDYIKGVKIFQAIVETKIIETTQKQIENLEKKASKILDTAKNISSPIKPNISLENDISNNIIKSDISLENDISNNIIKSDISLENDISNNIIKSDISLENDISNNIIKT